MATVEELVRDLLGSVGTTVGAPVAARWVNNRYQELVAQVRFRNLRQIGELSVPAVTDDGTVSVTRGSTTVTPDATAKAALLAAPGAATHTQYYFRAASTWYRVASITAVTGVVTLASAYAEDSATAASYVVAKRYHSLSSTARWLGDFLHMRLRKHLPMRSQAEMDLLYPGRVFAASYPRCVSQFGVDSNSYPTVELYPYCDASELVHYVYWSLPTALTISSTIPPQIDPYVLKEGVLIDLCRYEKAIARRTGDNEAANSWRNDEFAQRTIWERTVRDAIRTQSAVDDISFILTHFGYTPGEAYDQRTAHDMVYDRGY